MVVCGVTATGEKYLEKTEYTVDLGGLDFEKEGTYTITYTYKKDTSIKATLTVEVVAPEFTFRAIVGEGKRERIRSRIPIKKTLPSRQR